MSTEYEDYRATTKGRAELAAVELADQVQRFFDTLVVPGQMTSTQVAKILGITALRVQEIMDRSEGNVRVSTLAKFASIYGYEVQLSFVPVKPGVPQIHNRPGGKL